jgi:hypothetical protein
MKGFYEAMFRKGLSPAAALRDSQLAMSRQEKWQSPYYWAGFIIQGQTDATGFSRSYLFPTWARVVVPVILACCLIMIVSILGFRRRRKTLI